MKNEDQQVLGAMVDRLAMIKAQIADLKKEEEHLKQALIEAELDSIDGVYHRAAISQCDGRLNTNWEKIAMKFFPSAQLIRAHTSKGEDYIVVRVSARKTS